MDNFSSITTDNAQYLNQTIQELIQSAMTTGLQLFDSYCQGKDIENPYLMDFFAKFLIYQDEIYRDIYLEKPDAFKERQTKFYEDIYAIERHFSSSIVLFLEFLLGLCRFSLSIKLFDKFCSWLPLETLSPLLKKQQAIECLCQHCHTNSLFWKHLHQISQLGKNNITALMNVSQDFTTINFWQSAQQFFKANKQLKLLAQYIASMHYIPLNKKFLGIAQTLHWSGFGGSGELIQGYTQLQPLLEHRIGYHAKEQGGFNNRLGVLLVELNNLKQYANTISTQLLLGNYPHASTIKILDIGSGPCYLAVSSIIDNLTQQGRKIQLTASEVDSSSILRLKEKQTAERNPLVDIRYLDLNAIDQIPFTSIIKNEFDVVTCGLVLHQLGHADIINALKFFTAVVKPGGYILNSDVGVDGYYQSLLVPANMVDREGYVIPWQEHNILTTVVPCSKDYSKIAYPLRQESRHFPAEDLQIYTFNAYKIVLLPNEKLSQLHLLWQTQCYVQADQLVESFV